MCHSISRTLKYRRIIADLGWGDQVKFQQGTDVLYHFVPIYTVFHASTKIRSTINSSEAFFGNDTTFGAGYNGG